MINCSFNPSFWMTKRLALKQWKYALVYFLETDEVGVIKTGQIAEGYKDLVRKRLCHG